MVRTSFHEHRKKKRVDIPRDVIGKGLRILPACAASLKATAKKTSFTLMRAGLRNTPIVRMAGRRAGKKYRAMYRAITEKMLI
ncbi:hypothetical protein NOC27_1216 [Nitrosococcus oceani AFC27]|nr:hypothetical protein NOC27_1216 [Nitrosococcus oceani AFC27]